MAAYCSSFSLVKFSKARCNEDLAKKICDGESTKTAGLDFYHGSFWDLIALLFLSHSVMSNTLWPHGLHHAGFPVLHYLLEFDQIHVHWVRDAIWPSHPLLSPSPAAFNLSQHQGFSKSQLFPSGGQSIGASALSPVLPINIHMYIYRERSLPFS